MSEYPVQISKVQAPPLREETLARDRLLDWLSIKVHRRVVLLIAEAGYGKTTLLADFSRRTRLRILWFRLDRGDRDWVGFIAYLVAAVRIHVPDFGASTRALLRETATAAPPLEAVLDTFLRELGWPPERADGAGPRRLPSRRRRARRAPHPARAAHPRPGTDVLSCSRAVASPRFGWPGCAPSARWPSSAPTTCASTPTETERLFRDTYEMRLEPSVLAELRRRTEGWAASLQLVRAALHDRDPGQIRAFISSLSGAEGHLYEYLAEEVVGDLPTDLQAFLMRTSVLETVDLKLAPIAAEVSVAEARGFIEDGERQGMFGKGGPNTRHVVRAHPLVRDFLQARLARSIGDDGVRAIHLRVAKAAEPVDWRIAGRHYLAAGHEEDARRVLGAAIESILATGAYAAAEELSSALTSGGLAGAPGLVLRSRLAQQRAAADEGLELAEQAWSEDPGSTAVLLNLVTARTLVGDLAGALAAGRLLEQASQPELAALGRVYQRTMETSVSGSLDVAIRELDELSGTLRSRGDTHYLGVALLNLAYIRTAMSRPNDALRHADEAIACLSATSGGVELVSARLARAAALAYIGEIDAARQEAALAMDLAAPGQAIELAIEIGQIEALLGDAHRAAPLMDRVASAIVPTTDNGEQVIYTGILLKTREFELASARQDLARLRHGEPRSTTAFEARRHLAAGLVLMLAGDLGATKAIEEGTNIARSQQAHLWAQYGSTLSSLANPSRDPSQTVTQMAHENPVVLSMLAEAMLFRLKDLDAEAASETICEAERRPWRWRASVRRLLRSPNFDDRRAAARLLETIGDVSDIRRLRDASRQIRDRRHARLGYQLARRLADRVLVEDLGRVRIVAGSRTIEGGEVRRKVLALLCLLLSRPRFASTREEVVESLWPDLDPSAALNSLNQTVYFLRRVFEPEYEEDMSPGYVGQDGETIWLDPELVDGRSRRCLEIIRGRRQSDQHRTQPSRWRTSTAAGSRSTLPTRIGQRRTGTPFTLAICG